MLNSFFKAFQKQAPKSTEDYPPSLRPMAEFQLLLGYERLRADRSGTTLCLARFHPTRGNSRNLELSKNLVERLRATDVAGWFSLHCLAVMLPDTSELGAWKVVGDIRQTLAECDDDYQIEVTAYPPEKTEGYEPTRPGVASVESVGCSTKNLPNLFSRPHPAWKRLFDIVGAMCGLVVVSPVLLLTAILVKLSSPGSILFRQLREGQGGRCFIMYKFRTMRTDAEKMKEQLRHLSEQDGPAFKLTNDPRVTPIGPWLRKTSLDELPQLWNVLRGDMSFVGPRPLPHDESTRCERWQRRRLDVRPGLTCFWQARDERYVPFDEWMRMDLRYVERRTLVTDVKLIGKTLVKMITMSSSR